MWERKIATGSSSAAKMAVPCGLLVNRPQQIQMLNNGCGSKRKYIPYQITDPAVF
jgi:hypothetical protein